MEDKCILHTQEIEKLKTKVEELERKSMKHDDSIERGLVLSGKGVIIHENNRIEIQPHDFFEITDGNHQYVNTGNEPLAFVCFRYPR